MLPHLDCVFALRYAPQSMGQSQAERARTGIDGIGCVGLLMLVTFIAMGVSALIDRPDPSEVAAADGMGVAPTTAVETRAVAGLASTATLTPSNTATPLPSFTPIPTLTPTDLPAFVPMALADSEATAIVSAAESATPLPATSTPVPTVIIPTATTTPSPTATPTPLLPTPSGTYSLTVRVPILMYHYVSDPPEGADKYRVDLSVSPANFRAQLQYLADNGFTTIDLYELSLAITGKRSLPPKPVILTFDDGYLDQYTNAFPMLQEFGFTGTFFIVTEFVDAANPAYMSWEMIEEMAAAGMHMEPHSRTHADLSEQPRDVLIWQILGSQETLAAHIGYTPRFFCYPGGRYDEDTIAILEELDFWGAVVTAGGKWHGFNDRYEWKRLRMRNTTTLPEFADLVEPEG